MANDQNVVLVFDCGPGTRFASHHAKIFYSGEEEQSDGQRGSIQITRHSFDDDLRKARHFSPEQGVLLRKFMREQGYQCHLENRFGDKLFERDEEHSDSIHQDRYASQQRRFVPFLNTNPEGLGLIAVLGNSPSGPLWYVRASDVPSLVAEGKHTALESISGATPEDAAQRAVDSWGMQILFVDPEAAARVERERRQAAQQVQERRYAGLRPGDRPI